MGNSYDQLCKQLLNVAKPFTSNSIWCVLEALGILKKIRLSFKVSKPKCFLCICMLYNLLLQLSRSLFFLFSIISCRGFLTSYVTFIRSAPPIPSSRLFSPSFLFLSLGLWCSGLEVPQLNEFTDWLRAGFIFLPSDTSTVISSFDFDFFKRIFVS